MKKILIFSHEFPPYVGGVGSVGAQLATLLRDKYEVTVLTRKLQGRQEIKGVKFIDVLTFPKLWMINYFIAFKSIVNLDEFDTIILNEAAPTYVAGLFFTPEQLKKSLVYVHGLEVEHIYQNNSLIHKLFGLKKYHTNALNLCKKVIFVGRFMQKKFFKNTELEPLLKNKNEIIYAGLDTRVFKAQKIDLYSKLQIDTSKKILLSVGRVVKEKGFFDKYKIFRRLVKEGSSYHWIIAGEGNDIYQLKEMAKDDGLDSHITFLGRVDRGHLAPLYASSHLFWLLSNYLEALPLVYLEAQMCGTLAIGRNNSGVRETIINGRTGYLVDSDEACYNILKNKDFTVIEEEDILSFSKQFDFHKTNTKLLELIESDNG